MTNSTSIGSYQRHIAQTLSDDFVIFIEMWF